MFPSSIFHMTFLWELVRRGDRGNVEEAEVGKVVVLRDELDSEALSPCCGRGRRSGRAG
jgi:hypothetical protein